MCATTFFFNLSLYNQIFLKFLSNLEKLLELEIISLKLGKYIKNVLKAKRGSSRPTYRYLRFLVSRVQVKLTPTFFHNSRVVLKKKPGVSSAWFCHFFYIHALTLFRGH